MSELVVKLVEAAIARCDGEDRLEMEGLLVDGRGQKRHAEGDVEHARGVLCPLHVAGHPEQVLGGAAQHEARSRTQVSLVPPPWLELITREPL